MTQAEPIEWKNVDGVDQISDVINLLKNDPDSRRIILNSWNVTDLPKMKLLLVIMDFNVIPIRWI
jgi:thymidylate synthase